LERKKRSFPELHRGLGLSIGAAAPQGDQRDGREDGGKRKRWATRRSRKEELDSKGIEKEGSGRSKREG